MHLTRFLKESNIDLWFDPFADVVFPEEEQDLQPEDYTPKQAWERKEIVLRALVELLEPSGKVTNPRKCFTDLRNREAKATTALGLGVAMPHVRTPQAKDFAFAVAIAPEPGIWFDAVDGQPVRVFFAMIAPSHNDKFYRKIEKSLAEALLRGLDDFGEGGLKSALLEADSPGEVIRILSEELDV